jgi:adenosyl cobinamide kinase/adenosyl cobinamide phosphate guanylyltransferase
MSKPTIILLCGYARAGKDTFAEGMIDGSQSLQATSFATALKFAADTYLESLRLAHAEAGRTFWDEKFKIAHRDFLVTAGKFARSIDVDVFANALVNRVAHLETTNIVVTDWRYLNEFNVILRDLGRIGWRVVTVWVETIGVFAANEEEALTIAEIRRAMATDYEYFFRPSSKEAVKEMGKDLARNLKL